MSVPRIFRVCVVSWGPPPIVVTLHRAPTFVKPRGVSWTVAPELATTPVGAVGGLMERGIDRQVDYPKCIHLRSVGLHRPSLGPPKTERSIFRTLVCCRSTRIRGSDDLA